jgi:hypothetical protein
MGAECRLFTEMQYFSWPGDQGAGGIGPEAAIGIDIPAQEQDPEGNSDTSARIYMAGRGADD